MLYESHATRTWTLLWFGHAQGCSVNRMQLEHGRYSPTADTLMGSTICQRRGDYVSGGGFPRRKRRVRA